jgi:hypothetical protein
MMIANGECHTKYSMAASLLNNVDICLMISKLALTKKEFLVSIYLHNTRCQPASSVYSSKFYLDTSSQRLDLISPEC